MGFLKSDVRFLFDGRPVYANDTPEEHDMEDGDCLEIFMCQGGPGGPVSSRLRASTRRIQISY